MAEQHIRAYSFVLDFHRDEEAYLAYFPALPGCHTWSETYEGDPQAAINRFVQETNADPKPFVWTADPNRVLAAVQRGKRVVEALH